MNNKFNILSQLKINFPNMILYVLVDAALAENTYRLLKRKSNLKFKSLFDGTPDQSSFVAAPFLVQISINSSPENQFLKYLLEIETTLPAVNWLFSEKCFNEIFLFLQNQLYVEQQNRLPQLFRFYDVRHMPLAFEFFATQYHNDLLKINVNKMISFYMTKYKEKENQLFEIDEYGKLSSLEFPHEVSE